MLIDTHSHLNFRAFSNDFQEVINRSLKDKIWLINVGSQYITSQKAVEIAQKYDRGVFAAIGLHPIHLETGLVKIKNDDDEIEVKTTEQDFDYQKYRFLAKSNKVLAIGEVGLDYYRRPKTKQKKEAFKQKQRNVLIKQLDLAREFNLPVIFHCRMAYDDLIGILDFYNRDNKTTVRGVIHCFAGNWNQAQKFLEMGLYLGFNGIIFKKIEGINFQEIIKKTPLNRILLETDCPYLTPPQVEGRNEPSNVKHIAQEIAKIKNINYQEIEEKTTQNAKVLFKIV